MASNVKLTRNIPVNDKIQIENINILSSFCCEK